MSHRIVVLAGDGIGPEVMAPAVAVLQVMGSFDIAEYPIGAAAIEADGTPLPDATLRACAGADAILLGAVGTGAPPCDQDAPRPEQGVLDLRAALGLYANLRPARVIQAIRSASPLQPSRLAGVDLVLVRELTAGLYYGRRGHTGEAAAAAAFDTCTYSATEIERVARVAFDLARQRAAGPTGGQPRAGVTSVDKANVLATSRLWRKVVQAVADEEYPDIALEHLLVDTAAMTLVTEPARFGVILTENMFGDILSDEAAAITGSIGLLASASLPASPGPGGVRGGLFEPIHGSAPDIAGKGIANPLGMVLSVALMLRYGLGLPAQADAVEKAVDRALDEGLRTHDLGGEATTADALHLVMARL